MILQHAFPGTLIATTALLMATTSAAPAQSSNDERLQSDGYNNQSDAITRRIKSCDRDGDGKVSKAEASDTLKRLYFDRADANRDGFIADAELSKFGETLRPRGTSGQRLGQAHRAIVDTPFISADKVTDQVTDKELVIVVVIDGRARAYPINMLTGPSREIINDVLGDRAIAATW